MERPTDKRAPEPTDFDSSPFRMVAQRGGVASLTRSPAVIGRLLVLRRDVTDRPTVFDWG